MNGPRYRLFATYEEREETFRQMVGSLIPRRYGGPRLFWSDLRREHRKGFEAAGGRPPVHITANPRDCLAFGSARQVLTAALMTAGGTDPVNERVTALADDFGIQPLLQQPIRTLSGGETVLVAMAKAGALQPAAEGLVIASPFTWLSRDNYPHLQSLLRRYTRSGLPAELLVLNGENEDLSAPPIDLPPGPAFDLCLNDLRTPLSPSFGVVGQPPAVAAIGDIRTRLQSPCLIEGENGQGKSLLAKVLCRAVPFEGIARLSLENGSETVRLLFQDVMTQTLLRDPSALAAAVHCGAGIDPWRAVAALEDEFQCRRHDPIQREDPSGAPSLRAVKLLLAAVRLCSRPAALILDEPDWGLSREDAIAFVQAVIALAHRQRTAVMIISHKSWWSGMGASVLRVTRRRDLTDTGTRIGMHIQLAPATVGETVQ